MQNILYPSPARSLYRRFLPLPLRRTVHEIRCWAGLTKPDVSPIDTFSEPPFNRGFDRHRCVFIHIPKCAGVSILRRIGDIYPEHIPYSEFEIKDSDRFWRYFKFTFVRNPWDRLVSSYCFLKKGGLTKDDRRWASNVLAPYEDFEGFVKGWVQPKNIETKIHFVPQHRFICDSEGRIRVDFLGRFERVAEDWREISQRLELPTELGHHNRSRHRHYAEFYTPETAAIVAEVYARDIELFGYRLEGV